MALWQFDFYIVPERNTINQTLAVEDILSWKRYDITLSEIRFLKREKSWGKDIVQYGKADETCIEFLYENKKLEEISCRLDLRSLSQKKLQEILEYIKVIHGVIWYEGKTYFPKFEEIVELMKKSEANSFCRNPKVFFEKLTDNEEN